MIRKLAFQTCFLAMLACLAFEITGIVSWLTGTHKDDIYLLTIPVTAPWVFLILAIQTMLYTLPEKDTVPIILRLYFWGTVSLQLSFLLITFFEEHITT